MQHLSYISALLISLACLGLLDYRYKIAYFKNAKNTIKTLTVTVMIFVVWDILGILLKIFTDGDGIYRTGILLGPNFPIEELFFLILLNYTTLLVWIYFGRKENV